MKGRGEIDAMAEKMAKLCVLISEATHKQTFDLAYALGAKHALRWTIGMGDKDFLGMATPHYISPKVFLDKEPIP
jgi:hypothetical protein